MAKKAKKPAKRARKKTVKAKVQDLRSGGESDDVKGHLMGLVRTKSSFLEK